ncbi:hypothetical protein ACQ4PT_071114 [Festuca glaucescens]
MAAMMLCTCSGDQSKFEEMPQSPESLATRDFSASASCSRTGNRETTPDDSQVNEVESDLRETLSLNYEEARALLGRLEYQRGNFDAALQVLQGIDIRSLKPRMTTAITESAKPRVSPRSSRRKTSQVNGMLVHMSMHSVSLLLEAILLKAKSLESLGRVTDAAEECRTIIDIVESAWPSGVPEGTSEECKLIDMFHSALEYLPNLWMRSGCFEEAIIAYRRALARPWNLDSQRSANLQKDLAVTLLYCGIEVKSTQEFNQQQNMEVWKSTPYDKVKSLHKLEMEAWLDLASIYTKLESWHDSNICLYKAESINSFNSKCWHVKGLILEAQSLHQEALSAFSFSLSINPDYAPSMVCMAGILRNLGGKSLPIARTFLRNAIRLEPTNHKAWLGLGLVSKSEGLPLEAADCFKAAYELRELSPIQDFSEQLPILLH